MINAIRSEPVAIQTAILAVLGALVALGVIHLTDAQIGIIGAALVAVLGLFTRSQVTPIIAVQQYQAPHSTVTSGP